MKEKEALWSFIERVTFHEMLGPSLLTFMSCVCLQCLQDGLSAEVFVTKSELASETISASFTQLVSLEVFTDLMALHSNIRDLRRNQTPCIFLSISAAKATG